MGAKEGKRGLSSIKKSQCGVRKAKKWEEGPRED